jgi:hypothetical protein
MRRRILVCLTLAAASGCKGGDALSRPTLDPSSPPARTISDGSHSSGNPDFFFLPPMVDNPNQSRNWDAGEFKGDLQPSVVVCELIPSPVDPAAKICGATVFSQSTTPSGEQYQANWKVPRSSVEFYRITVYSAATGGTLLGSADVQTEPNASMLKNVATGTEVGLVDGSTLPIKFRVEKHALDGYASASVDLSQPQIVAIGSGANAIGVAFPGNDGSQTISVSVSHCDDLNPRALDLPVFGPCVRVRTDPAIGALKYAATVFACSVNDETVVSDESLDGEGVGDVLNHAQADRITLHRLDGSGASQVVAALRHARAPEICGSLGPIGQATQPRSTARGMFASLRRHLESAGRAVGSLFGPKPLYAAKTARFIDLGGGGFTDLFSDFQFALPASFNVQPPPQAYGLVGQPTRVSVRVCDVNHAPVRGVSVRFAVTGGGGTLSQPSAVSDASGYALTYWTLGGGTNTLAASGRGVGGTDVSGPRDWVDPFQPLYPLFDGEVSDQASVLVGTGSVSIPGSIATGGIGLRSPDGIFRLAASSGAPAWRIWNVSSQTRDTPPCGVTY